MISRNVDKCPAFVGSQSEGDVAAFWTIKGSPSAISPGSRAVPVRQFQVCQDHFAQLDGLDESWATDRFVRLPQAEVQHGGCDYGGHPGAVWATIFAKHSRNWGLFENWVTYYMTTIHCGGIIAVGANRFIMPGTKDNGFQVCERRYHLVLKPFPITASLGLQAASGARKHNPAMV